MTVTTRRAGPADAAAMAALINEIIAAGGTTAHERPFSAEQIETHYIAPAELVSCFVAEIGGELRGFQSLNWPDATDPLPEGWASIGSFVKRGMTGAGIGAALFAATLRAARGAGVRTIDATIRADNTGGLRYYAKMGFADYDRLVGVPLSDGTPVDRIRKRLDP